MTGFWIGTITGCVIGWGSVVLVRRIRPEPTPDPSDIDREQNEDWVRWSEHTLGPWTLN